MTDTDIERSTAARLYQVSYMIWTAPVFVIATDFAHAAEITKRASRLPEWPGKMIVMDVSQQFFDLSQRAHDHTLQAISGEVRGVVDYDDEVGWISMEAG